MSQETMVSQMGGFFPEFYLATYADLRNAFGTDQKRAWQHYLEYGINEGRRPNPFFDPIFYRGIHSDLSSFNGQQLLDHWVKYGIKEGRRGIEHFWIKFYLTSHGDLVNAFGDNLGQAFEHWKTYGNAEARRTAPAKILRIYHRSQGETHEIVAQTGTESSDPDLFKPFNTTGGQIGFGVGLVIGTYFGNPGGGAVAGTLIGHGLDRVITRVSNDITGPFWKSIEQGPIGQVLDNLVNRVGHIPRPPLPPIPFPNPF